MTWEQKIQACQALGDFSLKMRSPGDWYVLHSVEVANGCIASGGCVWAATTPEAAVEKHWEWLTNLKSDEYVVRHSDHGRGFRWNGFMWQEYERQARNHGQEKTK